MAIQTLREVDLAQVREEKEQEAQDRAALMQTIATLTLENADLKEQLQTLAQTIAQMQIGG